MAEIIYYPESFHYRDENDTILHKGWDRVEVTETQGTDPTHIVFCIGTRGDKVWYWKGIVLIYKNGDYRSICEVTGKNADQCGLLSEESLADPNIDGLYLSRTSSFGIHSNRYLIDNASTAFKKGTTYQFLWTKD